MRRREPASEPPAAESPANMTPMIDVTFLLLVFFLCTLRFHSLEGKLVAHLPKDVGLAPTLVEPPLELDLAVDVVREGERRDPRALDRAWSGEGRFEVVGRALAWRLGPRTVRDLASLDAALRAAAARDATTPVVLRPGPGAIQADVVRTLDALAAAGLGNVRFARSR